MEARAALKALWQQAPLPEDELLFNLGMFTRSSLLVKFIVMNDIYKRITHLPGKIIEFGTWWGQNLILMENLRAIHEPFNKQRRIVGFDTFSGYTTPSDKDQDSIAWADKSYTTPENYIDYLSQLIQVHEGNNALGHIRGRHSLVAGDVSKTAPEYFADHAESIVALAYFDIGLYEPTVAALTAIKPHLVTGSIILLDELTWDDSPGEAIAFKECFDKDEYLIEKCALYPSKAIITIR